MLVAADGENNDVGLLGDFDRLGNLLPVFNGIAGNDRILIPVAADGDFAAFAVEYLGAVANPRFNPDRSTVTSCLGTPL